MEYELRPVTADDEPFLASLYNEVHAEEFALLGLPATALEQLLAMQFKAQTAGYVNQFPNAASELIWVGGERAGRLLLNRNAREIMVVDIALLASMRGKGVGTAILKSVAERAGVARLPVRLSVRLGNPAKHLYDRLGFVEVSSDGLNLSMEIPVGGSLRAATTSEWGDAVPADVPVGPTSAYFRSRVGKTFRATSDSIDGELSLTSVVRLKAPIVQPNGKMGDSFTVTFAEPAKNDHPVSEMVTIQHAGDEPLELFLVAVGMKNGMKEYEAIFNRMEPLTAAG